MPNIEPDDVHVAVGVIVNRNNEVLIARRANHLHQGGLWEYPGGKVEKRETVQQALVRELREELDIVATDMRPMLQIRHDYGDKAVFLDIWWVEEFTGDPRGLEGQPVRWVKRSDIAQYEFPAANHLITTAIRLPEAIAITGDWKTPDDFKQHLTGVLSGGVRCVQLRAHHCAQDEFIALYHEARTLCDRYDATLIINRDAELAHTLNCDGLHLSSRQLQQYHERPVPRTMLLGASCHNHEELRQALAVSVDYVSLGPVKVTASHPDASPIGFAAFAELLSAYPVLVYALGGVTVEDLTEVKRCGGFGIASISQWW